jgi:hypothetical protein
MLCLKEDKGHFTYISFNAQKSLPVAKHQRQQAAITMIQEEKKLGAGNNGCLIEPLAPAPKKSSISSNQHQSLK